MNGGVVKVATATANFLEHHPHAVQQAEKFISEAAGVAGKVLAQPKVRNAGLIGGGAILANEGLRYLGRFFAHQTDASDSSNSSENSTKLKETVPGSTTSTRKKEGTTVARGRTFKEQLRDDLNGRRPANVGSDEVGQPRPQKNVDPQEKVRIEFSEHAQNSSGTIITEMQGGGLTAKSSKESKWRVGKSAADGDKS